MKDKKPKAFWNLFNELINFDKTNKNSPISADDWVLHFKNLLNKHYSDTSEEREMNDFINENKSKMFNELSFRITTSEIREAIKKLKNHKASGKNGILNEMIKSSCAHLLPLFEKL
jgi:anthranilate/para-aminobenzoate synthase component I